MILKDFDEDTEGRIWLNKDDLELDYISEII